MLIKLSTLLPESLLRERNLDLSKKEDAAEYIIRQSWKYIEPGEDRYDAHDVLLWIDNEPSLNNMAWKIAKQFYPNEEEAWYTFKDDVEAVLQQMELNRLEKKRKATPSLKDPLYPLKKLMVGTSWNQAKNAIAKQLPGRVEHKISDESSEAVFNRLYKIAMGETMFDKEEILKWGFGRMSQLQFDTDNNDNRKQYMVNMFLQYYGDHNKKLPEKMRVWRGTNSPHSYIRPGDFVTFDRGYAQGYLSGKWKSIVTDVLPTKDLLLYKTDPGTTEAVFWPEGHEIKNYEGPIPTLKDFWQQYRFGL